MFKRIATSALIFGMASAAPPAHAQSNCGQRAEIVGKLQQNYTENLTGGGLQSPQSLLELWTSNKTGSWTLLVTQANGISCIVGSGSNWHLEEIIVAPEGVQS